MWFGERMGLLLYAFGCLDRMRQMVWMYVWVVLGVG